MCTKHLQVGTCLFKVVCLIEVSSKFIQEKTKSIHCFTIAYSSSLRQLMISQMHFSPAFTFFMLV